MESPFDEYEENLNNAIPKAFNIEITYKGFTYHDKVFNGIFIVKNGIITNVCFEKELTDNDLKELTNN